MNIKDKKDRISDVMAIYIVNPTEENLKLIKNDIEKNVFDNFFINFVEKCDDNRLQAFFSDLIQTDKHSRIYKIMVHPLGFNVYHPRVYSLNIKNSYYLLNSPNVKDDDINNYFEKIGNGLFDLLFATRTLPLIKYRSGFSDNIVKVIQRNFLRVFEKFPELKEEFSKKNSTLLAIVDRDIDLPIMFHHASALGPMMHDVFGLTRAKSNGKNFEIDPLTDYIWNSYIGASFVTAKEKIIEDLKAINEQTAFLDGKDPKSNDIERISEQLSSTLEGLRDITVKQKCLNNHAKFQEKLTKEIDSRNLGLFYSFEEGLLNTRAISKEAKKTFFDIISLKQLNVKDINIHKTDILRLAIIYYLINTNITSDEIKEIEKYLTNIGLSLSAFEFFKQKRSFEESMRKGSNSNQDRSFLQKSISYLVKRIVTSEQTSLIADTVNNLASNKEIKEYVSFNLLKQTVEKNTSTFNQVIVFVVGGGSLAEYEYIEEFLNKNEKTVNIIYLLIIIIIKKLHFFFFYLYVMLIQNKQF